MKHTPTWWIKQACSNWKTDMTETKPTKPMTAQTAIDLLREMQRQVIHGRNTFGEIADVIEPMLKALDRIAALLNADDEDSHRSDDREGAMDVAFMVAKQAIAKARGEEGK